MDFRTLFVSILLVGLISTGIIIVAINTQSDYGNNQLANDKRLGFYSNLTNTLNNEQGISQNSSNTLYSQSPSVDSGGLMLTTIVSAGQILGSSGAILNILFTGLASILGISPLALGVFMAILIGSLVLLGWSLYRLGR